MKKLYALTIPMLLLLTMLVGCNMPVILESTPSNDIYVPFETERTGIDNAIAEALHTSQYGFLEGEFFTSASRVLRIDEDDASATVYLIASHGWYNRSSGLTPISGTGVIYGILTLVKENDSYTVVEYREYDYKALYPSGEVFPIELVEDVQANTETLYSEMRADKERKVIEYFGL